MMNQMVHNMSLSQLFDWINMLSFCAIDMQLYLDTHPKDQDAIAYFNQCVEMLNVAQEKYQRMCGSTMAFKGAPYEKEFSWSGRPLPWEGGNLCGSMKNA